MKITNRGKIKIRAYKKANPFFVVFSLVLLFQLLSYPFQKIIHSGFFDSMIGMLSVEQGFVFSVYMTTLLSFFALIVSYYLLPTRKNIIDFQTRDLIPMKSSTYEHIWFATAFIILLSSAVMFYQTGQVLPLLQALVMEKTEYSIYRNTVGEMVNASLSQFALHFLVPVSIFLSFVCIKRKKVIYRALSIALMVIAATFSLARSNVPISFLVLILIYLVYKPIKVSKLVWPVFFMIGLAFIAIMYSTKAESGIVFKELFDRIIHGQWLGMPFYFYLFKDQSINITSYLHPSIQSMLGMSDLTTPGREIMMYINPAGVSIGSAGNVPTYFVGEAYAMAGWVGVIISNLHVAIEMWLFTYLFNKMRKTFFTCCVYGWILYKISSGLISGYSAFLFSGLQVILLLLLFWHFCSEVVRKRKPPIEGVALSA